MAGPRTLRKALWLVIPKPNLAYAAVLGEFDGQAAWPPSFLVAKRELREGALLASHVARRGCQVPLSKRDLLGGVGRILARYGAMPRCRISGRFKTVQVVASLFKTFQYRGGVAKT